MSPYNLQSVIYRGIARNRPMPNMEWIDGENSLLNRWRNRLAR